ncbi:MAG: hypothetical protein ACKOWF_05885 [Chloroflexota bacterium]
MNPEPAASRRVFSAGLLAAAFGAGLTRAASAQDATPAAGSGAETAGHIVVRLWTLAPGTDYAEFARKVEEGYLPIIQAIEGFVSYYFANPGDGQHLAVAVFTSKAGADASTAAAMDWSAANLQGVLEGAPEVIEAEIWISATPLGVESRA